jgi:acyl carrier protein
MAELSAPASRDQFSLLPPYVAPRTVTEQKLAEIWQRALGVDCVGITDSYEDLGGSSLVAASICIEIEKSFAINIEMGTLLGAPTVEELALKVDQLTRSAKG